MSKNTDKNTNKNLKEPWKKGETGNPNGRPKGQRNYATIYREALIKIAESNDKTPEEIEEMMEQTGIKQALKGNFAFFKDIRDRVHGKAEEKHQVQGELTIQISKETAERYDIAPDTEGSSEGQE